MSVTQPKTAIRTSSKPLTTEYSLMFDGEIEEPSEFHEQFYCMREAGEGDLVNIHINTLGGCASTVSAFDSIKSKSPAHYHGILEGIGYSAGSALFLLCDTHEVADLSGMMIHTSQGGGFYAHSQGREEYGKHSARTARILVEKIYKDFLTEQEIEEVLIGKEIWLDADAIRERLRKRAELREIEYIEKEKQEWSLESFVQQIYTSIKEDCDALEYNMEEVLCKLKNVLDNTGNEEVIQTEEDIVCILDDLDLEGLKLIATENEIPFPHNIGAETLRKKIKAYLEQTVDN